MTDDDTCTDTLNNGDPCTYAAKYDDGKCGIHTDETDSSPGRPSKFSDELAQLAISAAEEGKSISGCERAAGVGEGTIANWKEADPKFTSRDGSEKQFFRAFRRARAKGESIHIADGRGDGNASFAQFMLASSFDYKKTEKQEHEHSGDGGGPLEVVIGGDRE